MIAELMILMSAAYSEDDLIRLLEEALAKYKQSQARSKADKIEVIFHCMMLLNKMKAPTMDEAYEMAKQFSEHQEWSKMKPKHQ